MGTDRGSLIEVTFKSADLWEFLGIFDTNSRDGDFERYDWHVEDWVRYPRPYEKYYILPGERVIYRELGVKRCVDIEFYKSIILPPTLKNLRPNSKESATPSVQPPSAPALPRESYLASIPRSRDSMLDTDDSGDERDEPVALPGNPFTSSPASSPSIHKGKGKGRARSSSPLSPAPKRARCSSPPPDGEIIEISDDDTGNDGAQAFEMDSDIEFVN